MLADRASGAIIAALGDAQPAALSASEIVANAPLDVPLRLRLVRDRLRELERGGVVAAADVDPELHGSGLHWRLTAAGRDLRRLQSLVEHVVLDAMGLPERAPAPTRARAVEAALRALADPVVVRVLTALSAATALSPTALEERCRPVARRTLYRRLDRLVSAGVVARQTTRGVPRRTTYAIAPAWRQAAVLSLLGAWWETRHRGTAEADLESPLRIVLPAVPIRRLAPEARVRWIVEQGDATQDLLLAREDDHLAALPHDGDTAADATVSGDVRAWAAALVADEQDGLRVEGDAALARGLLDAVRAALFASVR